MNIKRKITIGFGILVATLLLLFSVFIYENYESYRRSLMRNRLQRRAMAGQLYFQNLPEYYRSSYLTLPDQHESLLNGKNQIIYTSGPDDFKLTSKLIATARRKEVYFEYNAKPWDMPKEGVALAFKLDGIQYISVVTAYDQTGRQASSNLLFILSIGNIILLVIVAFVGFWFSNRVLRPFNGLIIQMNSAKANDFSFRLTNESEVTKQPILLAPSMIC